MNESVPDPTSDPSAASWSCPFQLYWPYSFVPLPETTPFDWATPLTVKVPPLENPYDPVTTPELSSVSVNEPASVVPFWHCMLHWPLPVPCIVAATGGGGAAPVTWTTWDAVCPSANPSATTKCCPGWNQPESNA